MVVKLGVELIRKSIITLRQAGQIVTVVFNVAVRHLVRNFQLEPLTRRVLLKGSVPIIQNRIWEFNPFLPGPLRAVIIIRISFSLPLFGLGDSIII